MEMIEPTMLLVLALVAFVAGFIDAVAGGGGMLTVPALLSLGLPPHIALGTNKLAATFASSTAAFTYYKKRLFKPQCWRRAFVATLVGATLGTLFVDAISTDWLEKG
ncbi:TSUP family transporter, partial [Vibrio parahaemolyticus]|nr:TSUP family transporter [Vibrio parahaemolyticus]